jgi:transmembrane sensor
VILESGEAYFQVARESRPFIVIAGERRILALGTAFTVRRDDPASDDSLTVTLLEGRIAVTPVDAAGLSSTEPDSEAKVLNPGERLRVHRHAPPTLDSQPIEKATGWMRGQLIFDHTPLREAIAEFNRYSSLKITVASPEAGAIPVGGIFRISDSKSFARAVAETYNLRVTPHDSELVLDTAESGSQQSPPPSDR